MSSSTDTHARRSAVVRHARFHAAPELADLDALDAGARRVVDPAALADALAEGYEDGRAEGHAAGYEAGRAAALLEGAQQRDEHEIAVSRAVAALAAAADELRTRRDETVAALESALVSGALELAEAVVGRELALAVSPGRDALVRALRLAEGTEAVVARLHPDDLATVGDQADLAPGRDLSVVADPSVGRGGCLLQIGDGCVDASLGAALERVRQVLAS